MAYAAKILRDSISPDNVRLTTIEATMPRVILAELNTHRMFSRNSASSRAIPIAKMLQKVTEDPFIPVYWGKNQKGMQAQEELTPESQVLALEQWLLARDNAVNVVKRMQLPDIDLHKQIANRLLEPWLWQTIIITATEWDNFWGLRCNPMAQPEIKRAAEMMRVVYNASSPRPVNYGDWHLPLIDDEELFDLQVAKNMDGGTQISDICKISAGRCARVSYLTHDGKRDPKADIELCDRLLSSGHCSPLEHVARPLTPSEYYPACSGALKFCANFRGWHQVRKDMPNENNFLKVSQT